MNSTFDKWNDIINTIRGNNGKINHRLFDVLSYSIDNKVLKKEVVEHLKTFGIVVPNKNLLSKINIELSCVDIDIVNGAGNKSFMTNVALKHPTINVEGLSEEFMDIVFRVQKHKVEACGLSGMTKKETLLFLNGMDVSLAQEIKINGNKTDGQPVAKEPTYTYLMVSNTPGGKPIHKIGRSKNVANRLKTLNSNTFGFEITLITYIPGDYEKMFHNRFSEYRNKTNREWFTFSQETLEMEVLPEFDEYRDTLPVLS